MQKVNELGNFKKMSECTAVLSFHKEIYQSDIIIAVAQYMIGKCKTVISCDESRPDEILVELRVDSGDIEKAIYEFNEEVINYSFYSQMMETKGRLREMILERVLLCAKEKVTGNGSQCSENKEVS